MDFKKALKIYNALMYGGILMFIAGVFASQLDFSSRISATLEGLGFTLGILGIILGKLKYKCPHCGTRFNLREETPTHCPGCGKKL